MNETTILDEVYAARKSLWDEAGGTLDGLFKFMRDNPIPGVRYADLPTAKPRRPRGGLNRARPPRASTRKKAARP